MYRPPRGIGDGWQRQSSSPLAHALSLSLALFLFALMGQCVRISSKVRRIQICRVCATDFIRRSVISTSLNPESFYGQKKTCLRVSCLFSFLFIYFGHPRR